MPKNWSGSANEEDDSDSEQKKSEFHRWVTNRRQDDQQPFVVLEKAVGAHPNSKKAAIMKVNEGKQMQFEGESNEYVQWVTNGNKEDMTHVRRKLFTDQYDPYREADWTDQVRYAPK